MLLLLFLALFLLLSWWMSYVFTVSIVGMGSFGLKGVLGYCFCRRGHIVTWFCEFQVLCLNETLKKKNARGVKSFHKNWWTRNTFLNFISLHILRFILIFDKFIWTLFFKYMWLFFSFQYWIIYLKKLWKIFEGIIIIYYKHYSITWSENSDV